MRGFGGGIGIVAGCLLAMLCACGPGDEAGGRLSADQAVERGILLINNGAEPRDLDPQIVTGIPEARILNALLRGLVTYGPREGDDPVPGAAERWELAEDQRTWTFHLRPDGRWSNGDPVRAQDFIYAWRRALTPSIGCEYADYFYMIEGAEAFHRGRAPFETVGLAAPDDFTLRVTLAKPTANFLEVLLVHVFLPVHPPSVEAAGGGERRAMEWTRPGNLVSNGPFRLVEWQPKVRIGVEANPHYRGAAGNRLQGIQFFPIDDEQTSLRAFDRGQAHLTTAVPVNRRSWYRERRPEAIRFDPYAGIYFFRINTTRPGLDDPRVRHALSLAVDRQLLVERITQGGERPALAYTPAGVADYEPPRILRHDPERARELLAEAGYPGGRGFPRFELLFNTSDNHRTLAEAVQQMWQRELGIEVVLTNQEWRVYLDTTQAMNYDVARAGWIGNNYVSSFLRIFESQSPHNETGFADPDYDRLLQQARHTLDRDERQALLHQAEERLLETLPVIPLYWYNNVFLIHPAVRHWNPKFNDQRPYEQVVLASPGQAN